MKKFKINTVGEFLRDKPYFYPAFNGSEIANIIKENQAIIAKINNLRNFVIHQDPNYVIKNDDYANLVNFVKKLKGLLSE